MLPLSWALDWWTYTSICILDISLYSITFREFYILQHLNAFMIDMHVHTYLYWYFFGHIYTCLNTDLYMFIHVYTVKNGIFLQKFPPFLHQIPNPTFHTPPIRRNRRCKSLRRDGVFRSRKLLRYLGGFSRVNSLGPWRPRWFSCPYTLED